MAMVCLYCMVHGHVSRKQVTARALIQIHMYFMVHAGPLSRKQVLQMLKQALAPSLQSDSAQEKEVAVQELGQLMSLVQGMPEDILHMFDVDTPAMAMLAWARDQRNKQGTGAQPASARGCMPLQTPTQTNPHASRSDGIWVSAALGDWQPPATLGTANRCVQCIPAWQPNGGNLSQSQAMLGCVVCITW